MSDFAFEITESIGVISTSKRGWTKELNRVSFNGAEPKLDIREWDPEHKRMGRGITLTPFEASVLRDLL